MNRLIPLCAIVTLWSPLAVADVLIRTENRIETYEDGEVKNSEKVGEERFWIGERKAAYIIDGRTIVVDREQNRFLFIRPEKKIYLEAPLPLDLAQVLSDELKAQYRESNIRGEVKEKEESRAILDHDCAEYVYTQWDQVGERRVNQRTITVWATAGVKFSLAEHDELLVLMRRLFGRTEALLKELGRIKGVQMRLETTILKNGAEQRFVQEVVEITEQDPPAGVYDVPEGFEMREQLRAKDIL